jgi:uncharacterized membrane protein required for colicin V production
MASLIILLIMAACATLLLLKGSFVKSFATFMAALCAAIVAFAWSEQAANLLIERDMLPDWAQAISFLVLFVLSFAILLALVMTLARHPIGLGAVPERIGRVIFGLLTGIILSGCLLVAGAMTPLSNNFPYQRFDTARPDSQRPHKALFNPDGLISRWFSIISSGSLGDGRSFAVLHADLMDHLHLNRLVANKNNALRALQSAIEIPPKTAVWPAPEGLKDNTGQAIPSKPGFELVMVRMGFTNRNLYLGGSFTPCQLRIVCKQKGDKHRLQGSARSVYPIGYLKAAGRLQLKGLAEEIRLTNQDVSEGTRWIDFACYCPAGFEPVMVAFKTNILAEIPPMVTSDEAPRPVPFLQTSNCATGFAKVAPAPAAKIYGLELAGGQRLLEGARLAVSSQSEWSSMQTQNSAVPARFDGDQITCVQAELVEPNQPWQSGENKLPQMLRPAGGYRLLSLKCNNPAAHSAIRGEQLPTLIDSAGTTHRPCGLVAAGKMEGKTTFEVDFCPANTTFNADGAVAKPFPDNIRLTEKAESISDFYVLFLVKPGTLIISVQSAGAAGAGFDGTECFLVN